MNFTLEELKQKLKGTVTLPLVPWTDDDEIDEEALRTELEYLIKSYEGHDMSILAGGSIGEFYVMTDKEWVDFTRIVVDQVKGRVPVMVGAGRAGTKHTVELTRIAEELGADAVTVVSPYYHLPTEEGLYRHFEAVAKSTNIGIVLYDNQVTSKLTISPAMLARLSKIDNIIACKENTTNLITFDAMMKAVDPADLVMITGAGDRMFKYVSMYGCKAFVSIPSVFAPHIAQEICKAAETKDLKAMEKALAKESKLYAFFGKVAASRSKIPTVEAPGVVTAAQPTQQSIAKKALDLIGLKGGRTRAPMEDNLTETEINELREILKEMGCNVVA